MKREIREKIEKEKLKGKKERVKKREIGILKEEQRESEKNRERNRLTSLEKSPQ
jgi:hypothetical protein